MADFVNPEVVAFIDWEDETKATALTAIESDVNGAFDEVNVAYRKPGADILEATTWIAADCDPLDAVVYCMDADTAVNARLTVLGITPLSIDDLLA